MASRAYTYNELRQLWVGAGGSVASSYIAAAIALAESSGVPWKKHVNADGSIDRGLWQVNSVHGYGASSLNPAANARQAVGLWHAEGFRPWTTFRSGAYRHYLQNVAGIGASAAGGSVVSASGANPYGSLVGSGLSFAGVDQGIDFTGKGAIYAPSSGIITRVLRRGSGWPGRGALVVEKLDAPVGGYGSIYYAEDLLPGVRVGSRVQKGQLVGVATGEGLAPGIEIGFADSGGHAFGSPTGGPQPSGRAFDYYVTKIVKGTQGAASGFGGDLIHTLIGNSNPVLGGDAGLIGQAGSGIGGALMKPVESLVLRGLLMIGGALLAILGLFIVAKALGAGVPPVVAAAIPGGLAGKAAAGAALSKGSSSSGQEAAERAAARERRAQEAHDERLAASRTRRETSVASVETKRRTKAEQDKAERASYFRGATDAAREQQAAAAARKPEGRPGTRVRRKRKRR